MADIRTLFFKNIDENIYQEVFWVADYESDVRFSKSKMADPTWRTLVRYFLRILMKIFTPESLGSLTTNPMSYF